MTVINTYLYNKLKTKENFMNLIKLADILIDIIKRDYKDDIAIVHIHGSTIYNDTHDRSDLDIYFIPKTERGYNLTCDFIFNGIGTDLWAVSWERLEHIAAHEENVASIITEGEVLYYGNDDDLLRFKQLRAKALDTSDKNAWLTRAKTQLDKAYKNGFLVQNATTLSEVRTYAISLVYDLAFVLAQLNQITIKRGRRHLRRELLAMPLVPVDFSVLYETIFTANNIQPIKDACVGLLQNTGTLVNDTFSAIQPSRPFAETFTWWYEEMIQSYNKIYHACETGDIYTPLFASAEFVQELNEMLESVSVKTHLPDMVGAYDSADLGKIEALAHEHQKAFESLLQEQGITPLQFSTFEEVEHYLAGR